MRGVHPVVTAGTMHLTSQLVQSDDSKGRVHCVLGYGTVCRCSEPVKGSALGGIVAPSSVAELSCQTRVSAARSKRLASEAKPNRPA